MVKSKVSVGTSTVAGLLATLAGFAAAVAAYKQGDRSEATLGTIAGAAVGAISLVTTMVGRFAQAHRLATGTLSVDELEAVARHASDAVDRAVAGYEFVDAKQDGAGEPGPLTYAEAREDPEMGDPLDATRESLVADPRDRHGAKDHPEAVGA
jgi:hypothetical protein